MVYIDYYLNRYNSYNNLADASQKVLACFKEYPEKKLGLKDILENTKIPRRTAIFAMQTLFKEGFLQKTGKGPTTKYQLTF